MVDLRTTYLGLPLKNPVVASASPISASLDGMRHLEDAGVSAIVMVSLFEEQIVRESMALDHFLSVGTESYAESLSYIPEPVSYRMGGDAYLELIRSAKASLSIPVIGSLNGMSAGGWTEYARNIEEAGADALELNLYYLAADPTMSTLDVEQMYLEAVKQVKGHVTIPVSVKMSPFFTSIGYTAKRLVEAGADGLALFNRFYQPDFDLEKLAVVPSLSLSREDELRLPLRWVSLLYGRVKTDFAITSGVHNHLGVLKAMMAGARVAMMASELLHNGVGRVGEILDRVTAWMEEFEYDSIARMQGSMSQINVEDPSAHERANYQKVLASYKTPTPF